MGESTTRPLRPVFTKKPKRRSRRETRETAMYERMTVGAACVIAMAALAGGPAAAATLTGFAGFADAGYQSGSGGGGSNPNTGFIDAGIAGPLGVPNLNFQVDVGGFDTWAAHTH